jgi:hypothetical protein
VSNTTARWEGFCFLITSTRELVKPKIADVSSPLEFMRGFLAKAKYAL